MLPTRELTGQNMVLKKTSEGCINAFIVVNMYVFRLNQKPSKPWRQPSLHLRHTQVSLC